MPLAVASGIYSCSPSVTASRLSNCRSTRSKDCAGKVFAHVLEDYGSIAGENQRVMYPLPNSPSPCRAVCSVAVHVTLPCAFISQYPSPLFMGVFSWGDAQCLSVWACINWWIRRGRTVINSQHSRRLSSLAISSTLGPSSLALVFGVQMHSL